MKNGKILLYVTLLIAVIAGSYIGYRAVQNNRYTPFGPGQSPHMLLWDNWKSEPVFKEGLAEEIYNDYYTNNEKSYMRKHNQ